MAKDNIPNQHPATDLADGENSLNFAALLNGWTPRPGVDRLPTDFVDVSIDLDNNALILTIRDPNGLNTAPTIVTLAGLGNQYAAYDGYRLSDIISGIDD